MILVFFATQHLNKRRHRNLLSVSVELCPYCFWLWGTVMWADATRCGRCAGGPTGSVPRSHRGLIHRARVSHLPGVPLLVEGGRGGREGGVWMLFSLLAGTQVSVGGAGRVGDVSVRTAPVWCRVFSLVCLGSGPILWLSSTVGYRGRGGGGLHVRWLLQEGASWACRPTALAQVVLSYCWRAIGAV